MSATDRPPRGVAVVGIACRLPGAGDHREFAANLLAGRCSVRELGSDHWDIERYYSPEAGAAGRTISKWCGQVDDVHCFDNAFFRISPREAALLDPQQRLLLEEAWRCVEDSGIGLGDLRRARTSVHVGAMAVDHLQRSSAAIGEVHSHSVIGAFDGMIANRVSHTLGLSGASLAVDAACASALVAIHMGVRSLVDGESDYALVGSVSLNLHPWRFVSYSKSRILSPEGRCKTFDREADGFVPGEGVGVLLLRRLEDAIREADHIYGVLTGSAVNHTGLEPALTAPTVASQRAVVSEALSRAGADPRTIGYVEAHGTGTPLGDPIEVEALTQAFGQPPADEAPWCWLGGVKPNIGHLEAAAGMAGLIKVLTMLQTRRIPPSVNLREPNPLIELEDRPFKLTREQVAWVRADPDVPRRAGVSAIGLGGVNSHVVVEEHVEPAEQRGVEGGWHPFLLSAATEPALERMLEQWRRATAVGGWLDADVRDVCATLATGRRHLDVRIGALVSGRGEIDELVASPPKPRHNPSSQRWWLRVGEIAVPDAQSLAALLGTPPIRRAADLAIAETPAFAEPLDRLRAGADGPAEHCALGYLVLRQLLDCGLRPYAVAPRGAAVWPVLAVAGALDPAAAARAAAGNVADVAQRRHTHLDLVEPRTGRIVRAVDISRNYLELLAAGVDVGAEETRAVLSRAGELVDVHHPLRSYLQLWNEALADHGLAARDLPLDGDGLARAYGSGDAGDRLRAVACQDALDRLQRKWGLPLHRDILGAHACELLDLLADQVLTPQAAVALLAGDASDLARLAAGAAALADRIGPRRDYPLLRACSAEAVDGAQLLTWAAAPGDPVVPAVAPDERVLDIGAVQPAGRAPDVALGAGLDSERLTQMRLALWLAGVDMDWRACWDGVAFRRASLPTYAFERTPHAPMPLVDEAAGGEVPAPSSGGSAGPFGLVTRWVAADGRGADDAALDRTLVVASAAMLDDIRRGAAHGDALAWVALGDRRARDGNTWHMRAQEPEDWRELVEALRAATPPLTHAVVFTDSSREPGARGFDAADEAAILLVQALMRARADEPVRVLHARRASGGFAAEHPALAGLARCVARESSRVSLSVLDLDAGDWRSAWRDIRSELGEAGPAEHVRFRSSMRSVAVVEHDAGRAAMSRAGGVRPGGVYLVAGGAGGLGRVVAEHLLAVPGVRLALAGRAPRPAATLPGGGRATYVQADIVEPESARALVAEVRSSLGPIAGVIHAAGVLRDGFLVDARLEDLRAVWAPKILGAVNLDLATRDEPLDFFALFSSVVALTGNLGQSGYAAANAFLDAFAGEREQRHEAGERAGRTISIGWPLWESGGMSVAEDASTIFRSALGLSAMPTAVGLDLLDEALAGPSGTRSFLFGDADRALELLASDAAGAPEPARAPAPEAAFEHATRYVAGVVAELIGLAPVDIDVTLPLDELGIDSLLISQFNARAEEDLGTVGHTLLFESRTLAEVAERIAKQRAAELAAFMDGGRPNARTASADPAPEAPASREPEPDAAAPPRGDPDRDPGPAPAASERSRRAGAIAIVGVSGRYPRAPDLRAFWDNLVAGRDAISEVPAERWDWRANFTEDVDAAIDGGDTYCNQGGFVDRAGAFDPLFFGIAPREAELVDPQERLFLQAAWHALEDAGYPPSRLGPPGQRPVGVFAGVTTQTYALLGPDRWREGSTEIPTSTQWSVANRVSYCLDLSGPSMPVDTACASSLSALHLACASLAAGECRVAIAGAVNLYLHPSKYVWLCQMRMLSRTGRCHAFGAGADGFVPGEGVGAIVLKPLADAEADGDRVLAVVAGSAVNHGGRTSGFTVPNPNAQAQLVRAAHRAAGVGASTIGYVEAHGTGTALGDPIEIAGLTMAFYSERAGEAGARRRCAIGSVKSNIGHLEAAAGMAGLTKVLLQLRHGRLVPSLHAEPANPRIDFGETPFAVQRDIADWERLRDPATGAELPRRAGISAFGAGGANAHVVIEEHAGPQPRRGDGSGPRLAVASARDLPRLQAHCANLAAALRAGGDELLLDEVAYQLALRREPLGHRIALLAANLHELRAGFEAVARGEQPAMASWAGAATRTRGAGASTGGGGAAAREDERDLATLGEQWAGGARVHWESLFDAPLRHVDLPGYPFEERDCSLAPLAAAGGTAPRDHDSSHPFISRRTASGDFEADLTGEEFHLRDHRVDGEPIVPAASYLEFVRAGVRALGDDPARLRHNVWSSAIAVPRPRRVRLALVPRPGGYEYTVFSPADDEREVHATGKVDVGAEHRIAPSETIDVDAIRARCATVAPGADLYPRIHDLGLQLGPSYRCIRELAIGDGEALSELELPPALSPTFEDFVLHPCLFDAALQGSLGLLDHRERLDGLHLPFSIGALRVAERPPARCFAHIVLRASTPRGKKLDVRVADAHGRVVADVTDLWLRRWGADAAHGAEESGGEAAGADSEDREGREAGTFLRPAWVASPQRSAPAPAATPALVLASSLEAGRAIGAALMQRGAGGGPPILAVAAGASARTDSGFHVDPADAGGFGPAVDAAAAGGARDIVFAWPGAPFDGRVAQLAAQLADGAIALLHLLVALLKRTRGPLRILAIVPGDPDAGHPAYEALGALLRTAGRESPRVSHRLVTISSGDLADLRAGRGPAATLIATELMDAGVGEAEVRYSGGQREVRRWSYATPKGASALRDGGAYLVTGGAGGLGALVAAELAATHGARLVLAGRRSPHAGVEAVLAAVAGAGGDAHYVQADVSRKDGAAAAAAAVRSRFGEIHGVVHCAGVLRDGYLAVQTPAMLREVVEPKVRGALLLDDATRDDALDMFAMFSSAAGPLGNAGQAGYAYASSFLDAFAGWREQLRRTGERAGATYSLDWPLWSDGGMGVDGEILDFFDAAYGIRPLATRTGLDAMAAMLCGPSSQTLFVAGDGRKMAAQLGAGDIAPSAEPVPPATGADVPTSPAQDTSGALRDLVVAAVAEIVKLEPERVDLDADIGGYGFDSLSFTRLANRFNDTLGVDVTPALFFEYTSVADIAAHLLDEFPAEVARRVEADRPAGHGQPEAEGPPAPSTAQPPAAQEAETPPASNTAWPLAVPAAAAAEVATTSTAREPIAIVGMHGVLPQSEDLDEFWAHLEAGRDLVTEIPADRWDWRVNYSRALDGPNTTNSKWGGFLREVDAFDHRFFGISPREAALMDPQQRLFLQTAYKAIEEAGYRPADLSKGRTGLYVGVSTHDYYELLGDAGVPIEAYTTTGMFHSITANRVSYLLDLKGPSFPIDTACSSSLVAVRAAIEAMWSGSCDVAIAGAVNLILTPTVYISFARAGMLSPTGRCRSFDAAADGYVRGEGVGALVLKPLSAALRDRDHIHAVIRGSAVNHGGRVNTLTTPNPNAQADLIVQAFEEAGVDPATVGYIEMHGTGTALGDPIEVNGLKKAFNQLRDRAGKPRLTGGNTLIGSVKSNVGHLEPVAGLAGIFKAVLAMRNGRVPGNLHLDEVNPHIKLDASPLRIAHSNESWPRPRDASGAELPRRAGVSSFGFGGVNGHVLLEEHPEPVPAQPDARPRAFVLSAMADEPLRTYAAALAARVAGGAGGGDRSDAADELRAIAADVLNVEPDDVSRDEPIEDLGIAGLALVRFTERVRDALDPAAVNGSVQPAQSIAEIARRVRGTTRLAGSGSALPLPDLAYTLQVGRTEMSRRVAVVATDAGELAAALRDFAAGAPAGPGVHVTPDGELATPEGQPPLDDPHAVAEHWVRGGAVDWAALYEDTGPRRLSLPTYPFARTTHWVPAGRRRNGRESTAAQARGAAPPPRPAPATPAADDAHATWATDGAPAPVWIDARDRLVAEHRVGGHGVLAGVSHIELAAAAVANRGIEPRALADIVWLRTVEVPPPGRELRVELTDTDRGIAYELQGRHDGTWTAYSRGTWLTDLPSTLAPATDLDAVRARCSETLDAGVLYAHFVAMGIEYGPSFRGIRDARVGDGEALARIGRALDEPGGASPHFHPTTMDAALQAIAAIDLAPPGGEPAALRLPFSVAALHKARQLPVAGWVHVRARDGGAYDVTILDEAGEACAMLDDVVVRERQDAHARFLFAPYWAPQAAAAAPRADRAGGCLVVHPASCFHLDASLAVRYGHEHTRSLRIDTATARLDQRSWTVGPDAGELVSCLEQMEPARHVWFLGGLLDAVGDTDPEHDPVRTLFHLLKGLSRQDRLGQLESLRVLVNDVQDPDGRRIANARAGGLVGFCKSLARELPSVAICCVDIGLHARQHLDDHARAFLLDAIEREPAQRDGEEIVLLTDRRLVKRLRPVPAPRAGGRSPYRRGGVYVIVGGAGGIGRVLAHHLAQTAGARTVLVGRSAPGARIDALLAELRAVGGDASYVRGDVTDRASMRDVLASVRERHGALHGVVHAAMELRDGIVERLGEDDLGAVLAPKVLGSRVLGELLADEPLDFLLFMSSVQSFTGAGGQSNYAAASTAQDAIARSLASHAQYPVRVVNWGFWGTVGRVATDEYRQSLAARGIRSIDPGDGMLAIERILLGDDHQVVAIAADEPVLVAIGTDPPGHRIEARPHVAALDAGLDGEDALERLAAASALRAVQELGLWREPGSRHARADLLAVAGASNRHERLVGALADMLVRHGYVLDDGTALTATARCDPRSATPLDDAARELHARHPRVEARLNLVRACAAGLPGVLVGSVAAHEILFPGGSTDLVRPLYEGDRLADYCNLLVAERVRGAVSARDGTIRILEVGAGTGSTTRPVLHALADVGGPVHYDFTDLSPRLLGDADRELAPGPVTLGFRELDIERPPAAQSFEPRSYEVVIAANVLHATRDLDGALRHARELLAEGGTLVLTEVTRVQAFHTVTFGLLDAWWHFEDPERRLAGSPLLDARMWQARLAHAGFEAPMVLGAADAPGELAQRVIVARSGSRVGLPPEDALRAAPAAGKTAPAQPTALAAEQSAAAAPAASTGQPLAERLAALVAGLAAECLGMPESEVDRSTALASIGVDSIVGVELISRINEALGIVVTTIAVFDQPTVDLLAAHIAEKYAGPLAGWGEPPEAPADAEREAAVEPATPSPSAGPRRMDEPDRVAPVAQAPPRQTGQPVSGLRAVRFERPGEPGGLTIVAQSPVAPGRGEVEIAVKAFPINFSDFLLARGLYPMMPDFPFTPGVEASGVVRRVGPGVERVSPGDEVIALMRPQMGGQAFVAVTDETFVVHKPAGISHEEACGFPVAFLAMYLAFERAAVATGDRVFIPAATGTNGLIAVQLAQLAGAEVVATAGSARKVAFLADMGVDRAINHRTADVAAAARERTGGRGVDVVVNTVADDGALQAGLDLLAPDGRYVEIAVFGLQASGAVDLSRLVDNQSIYSFNTKKYFVRHPERRVAYLETMASFLGAGKVRPTVARVFAFDEVAEAYGAKSDRETIGRIVVSVPDPPRAATPAASATQPAADPARRAATRPQDIAIVGMSARLPGAGDVEQLWANLAAGVSSIREVPADRWAVADYFDPDPERLDATYCKWGGFLDDVDRFDAAFFSISGKEAAHTDPQQRVYLEESWRALEDAGYPHTVLDGMRCGVFVGAGPSEYLTRMNKAGAVKPAQVFWGNEASILAARISYLLNLRGPSIAVNTACSSSLVALHLACRSLQAGETDLALAGGVFLTLAPDYVVVASNGNMLSPTGRCRTFDDDADGFSPAEGAGVLVLKPLDRALADGDRVHGVIKGIATNQDGRTNGITAPSARAQTEVELAAWEQAGIDPATIGYVEAHGTGTKLGDPIEVAALTKAFRAHTDRVGDCPIGSIKTNVGHAAAAAGVAGIIKVLLAFRHRRIPPSLNFEKPNRHIDFASTPFYVNTELRDWEPANGTPRRATVSGFGFSGTNAHVVLEEPPPRAMKPVHAGGPVAVPLSAKSGRVLAARIRQLATWLDAGDPEATVAEIAYNLQIRRDHFDERAVFMASDRAELLSLLDAGAPLPPDEGEAQGALAARYLRCEAVDWESAWPAPLRHLSLPTYPFDRTRHWFSANDSVYATAGADAVPRLEPTGPGRGLLTTFTGDEFYLRDHLVDGRKVLPGVVHLEVAAQAAREAGIDASAIDDVVWLRSFDVNGVPSGIEVQLGPAEPDVEFALVAPGDPRAVYASGTLRHGTRPTVSPRTDLVALERSCPREVDPADLYRRLSAAGLRHGPALATVRALRMGLNDALGRVSLPEAAAALHAYVLHPALLDGALQILAAFNEDNDRLYMPFSVDRVVRTAPLTAACAVHVARRPGTTDGLRSFDVRLLDDAGDELVALVNLTTRRAGASAAPPPEDSRERLRALLRGVRDGVLADDQAAAAIGAILDD